MIPDNARLALTLAADVESAGAGELAPESMEQAVEFIQLLASALVHLSHYTLSIAPPEEQQP